MRKIETRREVLETLTPSGDPVAWLIAQAGDGGFYLLAHADDGVIWGRVTDGSLITSHDAAVLHDTTQGTNYTEISPPLREVTLQSARLFNNDCEILLWRDDSSWRARAIYTANGDQATFYEAIDELQLLWGNQAEAISDTFMLLSDSGQGLRHIAPVAITADALPLRLRVRHLISEDETGFARITASRLVTLEENS